MTDEVKGNNEQPEGASVEVSEQELADLGDFLAQVQIVLIGHEQRIGAVEQVVFTSAEDELARFSDEGNPNESDGSDEDAGTDGQADPGKPDVPESA